MSYSYEEVFTQLKEELAPYTTSVFKPKFLIDAQLPYKLNTLIKAKGYDSIHTLDLPQKNATRDSEIKNIASDEKRILINEVMKRSVSFRTFCNIESVSPLLCVSNSS